MFTNISATDCQAKTQLFTQKILMLNGYSTVQYCTGLQRSGCWYTEDIQLLFIKSGRFRMRYGNADFEIGKGQIAFLKKNILIECPDSVGLSSETLEYVQFTIKHELVKEFTKLASISTTSSSERSPIIVKQGGQDWILFMKSFEPLLLEDHKPAPGLIKIKVFELLFHLSGMYKCIFDQLMDVREHFRTNITYTVEENLMNPLSVEQLAILSGRSLSSFRRDFMAIYNMPPSQWIRLKRLEKAKELLLSTTMSITDICYTLGFENIAHFSRLFKSHCGYPPSESRKNDLLTKSKTNSNVLNPAS